VESGSESFEVTIPEGQRLSLVDLATPEASLLAGAVLEHRPQRGATGTLRLTVNWSHPVPAGNLTFRLRVYASADATPPPVTTPLTEPGSHDRLRALVEQDAPVDLSVGGPLVRVFQEQIVQRGGQIVGLNDGDRRVTRTMVVDGGVTEVMVIAGIVIAVLAAICIVVGFATFGAVLLIAMHKGYNVDNAGYQVAVGEGESRQEHKMVFNLRKPGT